MRVGLLGLGVMGSRHLTAYDDLREVEVVTRRSFPYSSFDPKDTSALHRAMIGDPDLDAIDICLPTPLHRPVAVAALGAGKHVLCEKPMALGVDDCSAMLHAAEQSGRVLMVGHVLRFWPAYQVLAAAVRTGSYGPVRWARFTRSSGWPNWGEWLTRPEESGGAILDLLIHDFDQALCLFGTPDYAIAERLSVADAVECVLQYASGLNVEIAGGWFKDDRPFAMGFHVRASEAELLFANDRLFLLRSGSSAEEIRLSTIDPYTAQIRYFVDSCRQNCAPVHCPPESSAQAVQLAGIVEELATKHPKLPQKISLAARVSNLI